MRDNNWENRYDEWKLRSRDDELEKETSVGEDEDYVEKIGICPHCEERILESDMWTEDEDGTIYHFQCFNYKKKAEEKENGK